MVLNIFNAVSYFNGEEDAIEHDRGIVVNLENGEVSHCLKVDDWIHNYTIIKHKDENNFETEIVISSLDTINNDELIELREAYGYKDSIENEESIDDYSSSYKSKFE